MTLEKNFMPKSNSPLKVLLIENRFDDLVTSRVPLMKFLKNENYSFVVASPKSSSVNDFRDFLELTLRQNSLNFTELIKDIRLLYSNSSDIDLIMTFRVVPNIYGFIISIIRRKPHIAVVTGLGISVLKKGILGKLKYFIYRSIYRIMSLRSTFVVQNERDLNELFNRAVLIPGSGFSGFDVKRVDEKFAFRLSFAGRLLKSKGVLEAIMIAEDLYLLDKRFSLNIYGSIDVHNSDSISMEEKLDISSKEFVRFHDWVPKEEIYRNTDVLLFPSVYGEGVPRVLIEAMAYGCIIVTRCNPGSTECIQGNGLAYREIKEAISFINSLDTEDIKSYHDAGRKLFRSKFDSVHIYKSYLNLLNDFTSS